MIALKENIEKVTDFYYHIVIDTPSPPNARIVRHPEDRKQLENQRFPIIEI